MNKKKEGESKHTIKTYSLYERDITLLKKRVRDLTLMGCVDMTMSAFIRLALRQIAPDTAAEYYEEMRQYALGIGRKQKRHHVVGLSLYPDDLQRLADLQREFVNKGFSTMTLSDLLRLAVRQANLSVTRLDYLKTKGYGIETIDTGVQT